MPFELAPLSAQPASSLAQALHDCKARVPLRDIRDIAELHNWGVQNLHELSKVVSARQSELLETIETVEIALDRLASAVLPENGDEPQKVIARTEFRELDYFGSIIVVPSNSSRSDLRAGDTNYVLCGWCENFSAPYFDTSSVAPGRCSILSVSEEFEGFSFQSNLSCKLSKLTNVKKNAFRKKAQARLDAAKSLRSQLWLLNSKIAQMAESAPLRPLLPGWREARHFDIGSHVIFPDKARSKTGSAPSETWLRGVIRAKPGGLLNALRIDNEGFVNESEVIGLGASLPYVFSEKDFQLLHQISASDSPEDRRFRALWMRAAKLAQPSLDEAQYAHMLFERAAPLALDDARLQGSHWSPNK